jgi:septal ring factor EnvC (AmiA/AmiB activator)
MKFFLIFFILYNFFISCTFGSTINNLTKIKQSLNHANRTKRILTSREILFKKNLQAIKNNLEHNKINLRQYTINTEKSKNDLRQYSTSYEMACKSNLHLIHNITSAIKIFNKRILTLKYEQMPIEYKIMKRSLEFKRNRLNMIKKIKLSTFIKMNRCNKEKNRNLQLQLLANKNIEKDEYLLKNTINSLRNTVKDKAYLNYRITTLKTREIKLKSLIKKMNINKRVNTTGHHISSQCNYIKNNKVNYLLIWPLKGKIILNFGKVKHHFLDTYVINNGIKIRSNDFSIIRSITHGKVLFAANSASYGNMIIIGHGHSLISIYGNLNKIFVKTGQTVCKNMPIANIGRGDNSVLYFEIRYNNKPINPLLWLKQ